MGEKTSCPRLYPLQILSRKWSYVVMRALRQGKRLTELKHELEFITSRILSRELNLLKEECVIEEKEGLYSLTKEGKAHQVLLAARLTHSLAATRSVLKCLCNEI